MTNVPGPGFVLLLAAAATFVVLPLLAGLSLLVATVLGRRLTWTLVGVHAIAILVGVGALAAGSPVGIQDAPIGATVGLARFTVGVLLGGLLVAAIVEGLPIALGALVTVLFRDTSRERGLRCATAGYALGGVGGALVGLLLTGSPAAVVVGALFAPLTAFGGPILDAAATWAGTSELT
ncbi:hypothetical protein [Halobellus sp. H-GB7]|uniref:hypothetical protein n=1 Tax=Halobellus sp. H-GB7 TaxID=3069756 RepID=UPI0027B70D9D|nr:hypothetical protein [Halobellus sp. H-GB7]MDQ2054726.1 hypothetical protein [Halobellus sp. H-GB7]